MAQFGGHRQREKTSLRTSSDGFIVTKPTSPERAPNVNRFLSLPPIVLLGKKLDQLDLEEEKVSVSNDADRIRKWKVHQSVLGNRASQIRSAANQPELESFQRLYTHRIMRNFETMSSDEFFRLHPREFVKKEPEKEHERFKRSVTVPRVAPKADVRTSSSTFSGMESQSNERNDAPQRSPRPKQKAKWVTEETPNCPLCDLTFSLTRRKRHCRKCGRIVCYECSTQKRLLEQYGYLGEQRVCDICYAKMAYGRRGSEDTRESQDDFGLSHIFQLKSFASLVQAPTRQCDYCQTHILDLGFYQCSECKYVAHKRCCSLAPNTCSNATTDERFGVQVDRKEIERLNNHWKSCYFENETVNSGNFIQFWTKCVVPEIKDYSQSIFSRFSENELFRLLRFIDHNANGTISFEEYVLFASKLKKFAPEDQLRATFVLYDENSDGLISLTELIKALKRSASSSNLFGYYGTGSDLLECIAEDIFEAAAVNLGAKLSCQDLLEGFKRDPSVLSKFCGS